MQYVSTGLIQVFAFLLLNTTATTIPITIIAPMIPPMRPQFVVGAAGIGVVGSSIVNAGVVVVMVGIDVVGADVIGVAVAVGVAVAIA